MVSATSPSTLSAQPLVRRIATFLGWLSLFATLALLSPGVVATARADEPEAGPSCPITGESAGETAERNANELEQRVEQMRAELAQQDGDDDDVVVLNTRGHNYGATPDSRLGQAPPENQ